MQRVNKNYDYDPLILTTIKQVVARERKSLIENLSANQISIHENGKNAFLKNLPELREKLLSFLDAYMQEKILAIKDRKMTRLMGKIFMTIQSIQDIDSGNEIFIELQNMVWDKQGSPTFRKYLKQMINMLGYYFGRFGVCNRPKEIFAPTFNSTIEEFEEKIYFNINSQLLSKLNEFFNTDLQLINALSKLDAILIFINKFKKVKSKSENIISDFDDHNFIEDAMWHLEDPWRGYPPKSVIRECADRMREDAISLYESVHGKKTRVKDNTLELIYSYINKYDITYDNVPENTGDFEVDVAFYAFKNKLKKSISEKYFPLLETESNEIGKRITILLGKEAYADFVKNLCAEINTQCITKDITLNYGSNSNPLSQKSNNKFVFFGTAEDLPKKPSPKITSDAIRSIYGNKGL